MIPEKRYYPPKQAELIDTGEKVLVYSISMHGNYESVRLEVRKGNRLEFLSRNKIRLI
jgi:hypothetical protein